MSTKESNAKYRETHKSEIAEWKKANRAALRDYNREYQRMWRNIPENRAKIRKDVLARYHRNREANCEAAHWRNVKRKYGITKEQYYQIIAGQGGGCALCGISSQVSGKRLSVDHCHNSTKVRGVLCEECNVLLGRIESRADWVKKMQAYLNDPPAAKIVSTKCTEVTRTGFRKGAINWLPVSK